MLLLLLGASLAAFAGGPRNNAQNPDLHRWHLTGKAPGFPQQMDERLRELADAFGAGDYERTRQLVQALLGSTDDGSLRAEVAGFLEESYLAEGRFEEAKEAAERAGDTAGLARLASRDADYKARVARLQRIVLNSADPDQAALAQFRTAQTHDARGLVSIALDSYWKAIWMAPASPAALGAIRRAEALAWESGMPDYARQFGLAVVDGAPDTELASATCRRLFQLSARDGSVQSGRTRVTFERIVRDHSGTQCSDTARYLLGGLYAAEGQYEAAERVWAALVSERPQSSLAVEARVDLADARYRLGMGAFTDQDYEKAADWLGKLLPDIGILQPRSVGVRMETNKAGVLRSDQRQVVFSYGEACEKLNRWAEAAGAYESLAIAGSPSEEIALSRLVRCYANMGDRTRAGRARDQLAERFPDSGFLQRSLGLP
jgi:tetratricopeptide (TPR) repeat protein